jgi:poly(hydroxyalkanoate) depolymerase family esterase
MKLQIAAALMEATRLVRGGKLMEATAAIQRALGGHARPAGVARVNPAAAVIEGTARVVHAEPSRSAHAADQPQFAAPVPGKGGRFLTRTYTNHAGTLEYKTYIPAAYHGQTLPLVVMLHGCKQDPDDFAAGTCMNLLAEEHGFLVVYPKQTSNANVSQCWNWFQGKDQRRDQGEPSLIAGITRKVIDEYRLDARHVYVAGLSAGGAMAAIMGTTYPDIYAAAGVHSGLAYAAARDVPSAFAAMRGEGSKGARHALPREATTRAVPTIVFHGDRDMTVHPKNGDHVIAQASAPSTEQNLGPGIEEQAGTTVENAKAGGRAYTRTTYRNAAGEPVIEHWVVHGAGHAWSGGSANGSFTDPKGPDASREMLRFFLQHALSARSS